MNSVVCWLSHQDFKKPHAVKFVLDVYLLNKTAYVTAWHCVLGKSDSFELFITWLHRWTHREYHPQFSGDTWFMQVFELTNCLKLGLALVLLIGIGVADSYRESTTTSCYRFYKIDETWRHVLGQLSSSPEECASKHEYSNTRGFVWSDNQSVSTTYAIVVFVRDKIKKRSRNYKLEQAITSWATKTALLFLITDYVVLPELAVLLYARPLVSWVRRHLSAPETFASG